jgi:hypothetical protein
MTHVCFIDFRIVRLTHSITTNDSDAVLRVVNAFGKIVISSMFEQIIDSQRSQSVIIYEDGMAMNMNSSHYKVMMYVSSDSISMHADIHLIIFGLKGCFGVIMSL